MQGLQTVFTKGASVRCRWPTAPDFEWPLHNPKASHEVSRYALIRKDDGIQLETYILQDL